MATTNFVNGVTLTDADWFNDVDLITYELLGNAGTPPSTRADIITNLGLTTNIPAGALVPFAATSLPSGYLACDGSAVSRTTYGTLFAAISTTWGVGDGSTTFNLPDLRSRMVIGSGTGTLNVDIDAAQVNESTETFTVSSNTDTWVTGMAVVYSEGGTLTGLTDTNTYYVIRTSTTTLQLASSLANAQNETNLTFTGTPSGTYNLTETLNVRVVGEVGGEEAHAIDVNEQLSHTHTQDSHSHQQRRFTLTSGGSNFDATSPFQTSATNTGPTTGGTAAVNQTTGGNIGMNNMSPFAVIQYLIKI